MFELISKRDSKSYEFAIVEIEERIKRIDDERVKLEAAVERISSFELDYSAVTEEQQYELGAYVNLMNASTQLLVNPILGLRPKCTEEGLDEFARRRSMSIDAKKRGLIIQLCNFLYRIELDDKDRRLLGKAFMKNKKLLSQLGLKKTDFDDTVMTAVKLALLRKYQNNEEEWRLCL